MRRINLTTRRPGPARALLIIADLTEKELQQLIIGTQAQLAQLGVHQAEGFTADGLDLDDLRGYIATTSNPNHGYVTSELSGGQS